MFEEIIKALVRAKVRFVVIGGVAATIQGSSRFTNDIDICYDTDPENVARLVRLLLKWKAYLRGVEPGACRQERIAQGAIVDLGETGAGGDTHSLVDVHLHHRARHLGAHRRLTLRSERSANGGPAGQFARGDDRDVLGTDGHGVRRVRRGTLRFLSAARSGGE